MIYNACTPNDRQRNGYEMTDVSLNKRALKERLKRESRWTPFLDAKAMLESIEKEYAPKANIIDHTDGLSVEYDQWRFNIRSSNTEPVVRLNVESRGDEQLMREKTNELLQRMGGEPQ